MLLGLAGDNELENAKLFGVVEDVACIISEQCHEILESDPTLKVEGEERGRERKRGREREKERRKRESIRERVVRKKKERKRELEKECKGGLCLIKSMVAQQQCNYL